MTTPFLFVTGIIFLIILKNSCSTRNKSLPDPCIRDKIRLLTYINFETYYTLKNLHSTEKRFSGLTRQTTVTINATWIGGLQYGIRRMFRTFFIVERVINMEIRHWYLQCGPIVQCIHVQINVTECKYLLPRILHCSICALFITNVCSL